MEIIKEKKPRHRLCRLCFSVPTFVYNIIDKNNDWPVKIKELTGIDVKLHFSLSRVLHLFSIFFFFKFLDL